MFVHILHEQRTAWPAWVALVMWAKPEELIAHCAVWEMHKEHVLTFVSVLLEKIVTVITVISKLSYHKVNHSYLG